MRKQVSHLKHSAGLTLIELAAAMVIASIAAIGLGTGITSIVGFYQDDWVTKDVRFWGYESIDFIVKKIENAKSVNVRQFLANYDGLLIVPQNGGRLLNIESSEHNGLTENGFPMLKFADFPAEGSYKDEGQRIVALEKFQVSEITDSEDYREEFRGKSFLTALRKSLYIVEMTISVTTKYQGENTVEYIRFKRIAWAKDKYFR